MNVIVQKFGGSSLSDLQKIASVAAYIKQDIASRGGKRLIVVSAMGNETNELLDLAYQLDPNPPKRELDMLVSIGERKSMALFSIACEKLGLSTVSFTGSQAGILTTGDHTRAVILSVLGDRVVESLKNHDIVVVAGFQGVDAKTKEITTLGRGGSDLTAVAMASRLGHAKVEIFKDVEGIFQSMACRSEDRIIIRTLGWKFAYRMSLWGASVLHSRAAYLAFKNNIQIEVRCSASPFKPGTLIGKECELESAQMIAATTIKNAMLLEAPAFSKSVTEAMNNLDIVSAQVDLQKKTSQFWINLDNTEGRTSIPDFEAIDSVCRVYRNLSVFSFHGGNLILDHKMRSKVSDLTHQDGVVGFKMEQDTLSFLVDCRLFKPEIFSELIQSL